MSSSQTASSVVSDDGSSLSDVDSNSNDSNLSDSSLSEDSDEEIVAPKVKLLPLDYDLESDSDSEESGIPMKPISEDRIESNWEVAYVCAFLIKFTLLRQFDRSSYFQSVLDLEKSLLMSSPPDKDAKIEDGVNGHQETNGDSDEKESKKEEDTKVKPEDDGQSNDPVANGENGQQQKNDDGKDEKLEMEEDTKVNYQDEKKMESEAAQSESSTSAIQPAALTVTEAPLGSELLLKIIREFQTNCKLELPASERAKERTKEKSVNKRDWFPWLESWVGMRFAEKENVKGSKKLTALRFSSNILARTSGQDLEEKGNAGQTRFWKITWQEKIHLLRVIVDWQLTYSKPIQNIVGANYKYKNQKDKDKVNRSNYLSIEEIGTVDGYKIYHFDESPRIYSSFVPTQKEMIKEGKVASWNCIANSISSYRAYMKSLPVMPSDDESSEGGYFTMFKKGKGKPKPKSKGTTKGIRLDDNEYGAAQVRNELAARLQGICQNEMKTRNLITAREQYRLEEIERVKASAILKEEKRLAKKMKKYGPKEVETETMNDSSSTLDGGRRVTKKVLYTAELKFSDDSEGDDEVEGASKKRKDKPEEEDEQEFKDEDGSDEEGRTRKSKRVKKEVIPRAAKVKVVKEWNGERRSSRLSRGSYIEKEEDDQMEEEIVNDEEVDDEE